MTIKSLIKILQQYNQNAEVRVITDRAHGETAPATVVSHFNEHAASRIGFAAVLIDKEKEKKNSKKIVIG